MQISVSEEFTKDWDWFAVDQTGSVGHFTSAGLRALPRSVKSNVDAVVKLVQYFFNDLSPSSNFLVAKIVETHVPRPNNSESRRRFLASFVEMASKGIFSYNSDMVRGQDSGYYLVAKPLTKLKTDSLGGDIRALLERTKAPISFADSERILELDTLNW